MREGEGRVLGRNPNKVLRVFLWLEISISSNSRNLLDISTVQLLYTVKEKGGNSDRKPYPLSLWFKKSIQKPSSLRTLKTMPRNLNEIVCLWIRLLDWKCTVDSKQTSLENFYRLSPDLSRRRPSAFVLLLLLFLVARQGGKRGRMGMSFISKHRTLVMKSVFKGTAFLDLWDYFGLWE